MREGSNGARGSGLGKDQQHWPCIPILFLELFCLHGSTTLLAQVRVDPLQHPLGRSPAAQKSPVGCTVAPPGAAVTPGGDLGRTGLYAFMKGYL